jgi:hypothetical protein
MAQRTLLAQGSILIDVPSESVPAFLALPADERAAANDHFRYALMGGNEDEDEELFEQLHQSEFRMPLEVDDEAQPELDDVRSAANRVIAAYNARVERYDLTFAPLTPDEEPIDVRYAWDPETGQWLSVHTWGLTVATGNASADDFNWLPLEEAQRQGDYELPEDLDFLVQGNDVLVELHYQVSVALSAE